MSQINYTYKIINNLLKTNNHIRGIARNIKSNQTTISRKINELYNDNIVDFKVQGRNKIFFIKNTLEAKQFVFNVENQKIINIVNKYPNIRHIIEEIKSNKKIDIAILFGSYAKSIAKSDSDIDIYIDTNNKKLKEFIENIDSRINVKIGKYNHENLLIKEINKNHIIIKGVEQYYEKNKFFN